MYSNLRLIFFLIFPVILSGCFADEFENEPKYKVRVMMAAESFSDIEEILSNFSSNNNYNLRIARVSPDDPQFSISLIGDDSMILGTNPFDNKEYRFNIYASKKVEKTQQFYESRLNELENEISKAIAAKP